MKKLLVVLCAAFVLVGCGGNGGDSDDTVKKSCKLEQEGISIVMDLEGKDDTLTKVSLNIVAPYETMEAMGLSKDLIDSADEDTKKQAEDVMEEVMMSELELNESDGYTVSSGFDDEGWKMSVSAEASLFEQTFNASSMEDMTKELSGAGYTCE